MQHAAEAKVVARVFVINAPRERNNELMLFSLSGALCPKVYCSTFPFHVHVKIVFEWRLQDKSKVDEILPQLMASFERSFQLLTAKNEELSNA
jgi:hypothetical protein